MKDKNIKKDDEIKRLKKHIKELKKSETTQKNTEKELKETKKWLSQIVDGSSIPTFVIDKDHKVTHWNKACENLVGASACDIIGTGNQWLPFYSTKRYVMADLVADGVSEEEFAKKYPDKYRKSDLIDGAYEGEDFFPDMSDSGKWLHFTVAPLISTAGKIIGSIETLHDITERKQAEKDLKNSEEKYRLLADNTIDCIWKMDKDLKFTYVNPSIFTVLGFTPEEWVGSYLAEHCSSEELKNTMNIITEELRKKETFSTTFEMNLIHKDGREISAEINGKIILDDKKNLIEFQGTTRDITERKQAEEDLRNLKNELEIKVAKRTKELKENVRKLNRSQKAMLFMIEDLNKTSKELRAVQEELIHKERLATLGQFSGSISHELRNPLGVIDSSIYYLKRKLKNKDENVQQHLERIKSSVHRSTTIIQSLLNLTRMKEPKMIRNDLVSVVLDSIKTSKAPNKVKVIKHFPDMEIPVYMESEQIRMALKNIIKNAIEVMEGQGTLTVKIKKTGDGYAEVSFNDTGKGIVPENLEKIFQPLFTTKARGIGFGLSISKMIIENHKGSIKIESEPGNGANFIINLPMCIKKEGKNE